MLRPLPVRSPERLVAFTTAADSGWATWSYAAFARWQRLPASGGLYEVAAASDVRPFRSARGSGESPEEVPVSLVSHNYFDAIGARVVLGRPFAARDAAHPAPGPSRLSATASGAGGSAARPTCWRGPSNWAGFSLLSSGSPNQDSPGSPSAIPPTCGSR